MSRLLEVQRHFQAYVLGEEATPPPSVASDALAGAAERLGIYAEGVRLRFLDVLAQDYPGVRGLVGADAFETLARGYAAEHPSTVPSIRWYGRFLPRFLARSPDWRSHPWIAEMARFEWCKGELLDAADALPIGVDDIAAIPPERWAGMQPRPVPATRRLELGWNTPVLWRFLESEGSPGERLRRVPTQPWLLWRNGITLHWRSLEATEAWAFDAMSRDVTFGAICEELGRRDGEAEAPLRAATLLKQWAVDGLLAGV